MEKKTIRLYNLIFPLWMLVMFPHFWLAVLPANFLVDSLVLRLTMKHLGIGERKALWRASILRVWACGFLADFVGGFFMLLWNLTDVTGADFANAVIYDPFQRPDAFLWVTFCVVLTGAVIYLMNRFYCLRKLALPEPERRKLALSVAVFTAPYLFYLPTAWFF